MGPADAALLGYELVRAGAKAHDPIEAKLLDPPDRRSIGRVVEVVAEVLANGSLFPDLLAAMTDAEPVVQMRAADAVEKITRTRPDLLEPHAEALLTTAASTAQKEVRWHAAQLLSRVPLNGDQQARAVAVLFEYLSDESSIVKTCALQALADLSQSDSELQRRVLPLIEELTATGTPAMRARGRKLLIRLTSGTEGITTA